MRTLVQVRVRWIDCLSIYIAGWWAWSLGWMSFLGVSLIAQQAQAASYQCTGRLRVTKARRLSCHEVSWRSCRVGSVIVHPQCAAACRNACKLLRKKQRRVCQGQAKPAPFCPDLAKRWRRRCAQISRSAQQICRRKADVLPCRDAFHLHRTACAKVQKKHSKECRVVHKRRLRSCRRLQRSLRLRRERRCKRGFARCLKRCVPLRWPCRKQCFSERHRCLQEGQEKDIQCRQVAVRLLEECEIKADQQQTQCTQKGEGVMYDCMQRLRRKRTICMLSVGRRYHQCVQKASDIQLQCWFRKMGREYLCSGEALRDCLQDLQQSMSRCLRKCPRCRVAAARP